MPRPLLLSLLVLAACAAEPEAPAPDAAASGPEATEQAAPGGGVLVGEAVPGGEALTPDDLLARADALDGKTVTVEGTVREVCQMAGCWLTLAGTDGRTVRVSVPRGDDGYAFTFPTGADGRRVRLFGPLAVETESVEAQRHYAEDGGASADELAAITAPKRTVVLTALGAELAPPRNA